MARKARKFRPWNKGKQIGQKRPFTPGQVQLITRTMIAGEERRHMELFTTGIETMLRGSDLVALRVEDVCDEGGGSPRSFPSASRRPTSAPSSASLDIIVFCEIHGAALCYLSLQRSRFWSRGTSQRQETLVARLPGARMPASTRDPALRRGC